MGGAGQAQDRAESGLFQEGVRAEVGREEAASESGTAAGWRERAAGRTFLSGSNSSRPKATLRLCPGQARKLLGRARGSQPAGLLDRPDGPPAHRLPSSASPARRFSGPQLSSPAWTPTLLAPPGTVRGPMRPAAVCVGLWGVLPAWGPPPCLWSGRGEKKERPLHCSGEEWRERIRSIRSVYKGIS